MQACERMLTKKVAIVQGPPGTGKTFTSISAIKALIENNHTDTPIIVAAQTNHALDQLLNRILNFEPNILRLGGRCDKENVEILKRTLYSLRMATPNCPGGNAGIRSCRKQLENKVIEIQAAMMPLLDRKLLTDDFLLSRGVISQAQRDSLYDDDWTSSDDVILGQDGEKRTPLETCKFLNSVFLAETDSIIRAWRRTSGTPRDNPTRQPWTPYGGNRSRIRTTPRARTRIPERPSG